MANLTDYVAWRGDLSLEASPWNEVDALLMAVLSYMNFKGVDDAWGWTLADARRMELLQDSVTSSMEARRSLFAAMADSARFGECRMHHGITLTSGQIDMQFSAVCVDLPDGALCVAFRGTDNTLVGWKEDLNMAYQPVVPAQEAAEAYLAQAAQVAQGRPIRVVGHSKGGNLAVYAAAKAAPAVQDRLTEIDSFDGPGMNAVFAGYPGYLRICPKIRSFVPRTSIIGLLMEYYRPYTVVQSDASGISQHDPMTWRIRGPQFERAEKIDETAAVIRDTLHDWLGSSTPEQRATFVETLFQVLETTGATHVSDLTGEKFKSLMSIISSSRELDPVSRKLFSRLMAQAVSLGVGNVMDLVRTRRERDAGDQPEEPSAGEEKK